MPSKTINTISKQYTKIFTVLLMAFCLWLLTGLNFFVYPLTQDFNQYTSGNKMPSKSDTKNIPQAPEEEKSSSANNGSIQEEYIHEKDHSKDFNLALMPVQTKSHDEEKLPTVHFELISPPPKA